VPFFGMPRKVSTGDGKRKADAAAAATQAPAKKTCSHRTPQTPFESGDKETTYIVDKMVGTRWNQGSREYLVRWKGYAASADTWEPMENLVGCAQQIREYEKLRGKEDIEAKAAVLAKRQEAKNAAAVVEADLKARAAEAALAGAGDGNASAAHSADTTGSVHKAHAMKKGLIWSAYDKTGENPSCLLVKGGGWQTSVGDAICGCVPSDKAGTSNYWSHLWTHHRLVWYELKRRDGALNPAGEASMAKLKEGLANMAAGTQVNRGIRGEQFLSPNLSSDQKETMDRIVAEWIVDEDQCFSAASTTGFKAMMSTATNGSYDGCYSKTVQGHVVAMGMEGKEECTAFHRELLAGNIKPAASGDLWSKNGTALFGLVSHGIRRTSAPQEDGSVEVKWKMVEKLAGAVPCSDRRHTGEYIGELSNAAWAAAGIVKPTEEIFARICDNGSNMIKGWKDGFLVPCADHTQELSVNLYTKHPRLAATFDKGRGIVGYFNSSVVGYNEEGVGLHVCQKSSGVPENKLTQDVKTRWRSTHGMTDSLRVNQEPLLLYEVRNAKVAEGFKNNRLSLEDWNINNQSVALLTPLANASQYLEGKNYATSNLVIPSMYGCIELLHPNAAVRQPWDGKLLQPKDLRPEVTEGRQVLYDDMVRCWKTEISTELRRFYLIATICDPRQQGLTFPGVSQEERLEAHEWFEAEYDSLWNTSAPEEPSVPALAPAASASLPVPTLTPAASASASLGSFVDFMASVAHLQAPVPAQVSRVKSEAHRYLELPAAPMNTDPLEWWAANEINFPALSVMARQYLGVPATSASAERLFSLAGRAFDDLRQCMKEEMLEILMWARINKEKRQRD
jgi:zinc finger BED domain-containing protein 1 (E3 SUMO-protein ligase ZBED1)